MTAESRPAGSQPATTPTKTKWVSLILLVIVLCVITWPVWDEGCPVTVNLVRQEPSGILDLNHAEARLLYVSIVNDGGKWVLFNGMKTIGL